MEKGPPSRKKYLQSIISPRVNKLRDFYFKLSHIIVITKWELFMYGVLQKMCFVHTANKMIQ